MEMKMNSKKERKKNAKVKIIHYIYYINNRKYGNVNAWRKLCEVFDYMPLGCVIDGSILCIHGGLSPDISMIE